HMGNARGGALGDVLAATLSFAGYEATREFYINDAGNQIEKFGMSLSVRYLQHYKGEDAVILPEDAYQGLDIKERAEEYIKEYGDVLLEKTEEERRLALIQFALPKNVQKLKDDLSLYRINYDVWFSEKTLHTSGAIARIIDVLRDKGAIYEKDGAIWYKATDFGSEKDEVLIRANGNPTYFAADIAYHYNKFAERGFDRVINVWGADHHGHIARLKGAMDAIGLCGDNLDIVLMQLVKLVSGGQVVKMSKRSGKAITLTNLIEDVPLDAARFFFNLREPNSTLEFDLDLAVEQSSQNPVYYVQYAHARICSIFKALAAEGVEIGEVTSDMLAVLTSTEERELIRHIATLPNEIYEVVKNYDPSRLTKYVIEVVTRFHKFYNAHRVKGESEEVAKARLALCKAVNIVIENVFKLLCVTAPESM
ncbi:MAG: arginine--tRNA ligase, partial [Oscillospiraceae bacterium]|nr:arginine--tRNA ligase [Oscillospiraceae bacterium]